MDAIKPAYDGACVCNLVPHLLGGRRAPWMPSVVEGARAVVLFVIDGFGQSLLDQHAAAAPVLSSMEAATITTVMPSTTVTAMTSITTGLPPAEHGIVAYRMRVREGILNLLRWSIQGQTSKPPDPAELQPRDAFAGQPVPVVTAAAYHDTGFSNLHLRGASFVPWYSPSGIGERCRRVVADGARFVFAYYGGFDIVAHMHGLHDGFVPIEVRACDDMVGDLLDRLPSDVAVLVTADHGHVHFTEQLKLNVLHPMVDAYAGEARFRILHAKPGAAAELWAAASELCAGVGRAMSAEQVIDEGWLGPKAPGAEVAKRIGDVVLAASEPVGFVDPTNRGEGKMLTGHGSFTPDEMLVPLYGGRGRGA